VKTKTQGIQLPNGNVIKPVVIDCSLGTTGEGPPSIFGGVSHNNVINTDDATIILKSITRFRKPGNFGSSIFSIDGWAMSSFFIPLPKKFCYFSFLGLTINSFGLTNEGVDEFFENDWKTIVRIGKKVIISIFVEFGSGSEDDIQQAYENAVYMMNKIEEKTAVSDLLVAVIFNASCPNLKEGVCSTTDGIVECAKRMKEATPGIALGVKLSYVQPVSLGVRLHKEAKVDFLQGINTIPWKILFPRLPSILSHIGGGGISGPLIRQKALEYVTELRRLIPDAKIIAGGGISSLEDAIERSEIADVLAIGILVNKKPNLVNTIIYHFNN